MRINSSENRHHPLKQSGISLIELVIFIVIMSVALTGITLIYINTTRYSADPMVRIRSIELAQSTLEEILLKAYDDNTPVGGGCVFLASSRCLFTPANPNNATVTVLDNTVVTSAEEGNLQRATYNDVDDYHNKLYCGATVTSNSDCPAPAACQPLLDESGTDISALYAGYSVCIQLSFAGGAGTEISNGAPGAATNVLLNDAKRIDVIVTDPLNSRIRLSAYRLNY